MPLNPLILVVKGLMMDFSLVDLVHQLGHLNVNSENLTHPLCQATFSPLWVVTTENDKH